MRDKFSAITLISTVTLLLFISGTPAMGTVWHYKATGETLSDKVPVILFFEYDDQGNTHSQSNMPTELIVGTEHYWTTDSYIEWDIAGPELRIHGDGVGWDFWVDFGIAQNPPYDPDLSGLNVPLALDDFGKGYGTIDSPEYPGDYPFYNFYVNTPVPYARVPEPATIMLLGVGLLGLIRVRIRK